MSVIVIEDLVKTYQSGILSRRKVEAVRGVTLSVEGGEIFGILGPNGAGKTTIVKMMVGLIAPTSGHAEILGHGVGTLALRRKIGYLPEHHRFPGYLTGRQALLYYGQLSGMSPREILAREPEVLELVGMREWADTRLREYSKGMGQRLGLAQALIHDPEVIFLDEPTDGVDPVGRAEIRAVLKELGSRGKTVFVNSHLLQEVELMCERVAILSRGQVLKSGTMKEITSRKPRTTVRIDKPLGDERAALAKLFGDDLGEETVAADGDGKEREFSVPSEDAGRIDEAVDLLRELGFSIRAMIPHKVSLEDAFLEAVGGRQVGGTRTDEQAPALKAKVVKAKTAE